MNQSLSNESLTLGHNRSLHSASAVLHPSLRRALGVLDARLEDELERYRRYRAGLRPTPSAVAAWHRSMTPPVLDLPNPGMSLDLLNLVAPPAQAAPTATPIVEAPVDEEITVNQTTVNQTIVSDAVMPPLPPRTPLSFQNDLPPDASSALVLSAIQADMDSAEGLIRPEELSQDGFGFGLGDGLATDQGFGESQGPHDYFESSEELLRSLAEEEATVAAERNVLEGLLTPMGVGSMLLMLLGSGMFGYLIMNPASLNAVKGLATQIAAFRSNSSAQPSTNVASVDVDGPNTADGTWMSNSPALDANEFLNLSLGNISALRTRPGGLNLMPQPGGVAPLQQLDGQPAPGAKTPEQSGDKATDKSGSAKKITGLTPLNIKPIVPPTPAISRAGSSGSNQGNQRPIGNIFDPARNYEPAPAPRYNAPNYSSAPPSRPARSYEPPRYEAPAYKPEPVYVAPIEPVRSLPPAPVVEAPIAVPEPRREYRVEAPYTSDADLEAIQKDNPNASFRNGDSGANVGASYSSQAEAEAEAARWREKGIEAEVK
jgi:hypothetical protein